MEKRWLVIFIGLLVLIVLYWTRYQVVGPISTPGSEYSLPSAGFYKINRLTGEIIVVSGIESLRVKSIEETLREKKTPK
jgi:hypothetical protein